MDITKTAIALIIGILLGLSGCAGTSVKGYLKPGVTISQIESVAVIPFDNLSQHPDAGKKVVNLLLTELVNTGLFRLADMGEVESSLRRLRIRTTAEIDLSKLKTLGDELDIQTIIVGSIDEYELRQGKAGLISVVSVNARMLDVGTGDILWAINNAHDGEDWETIFGFGKVISLSQLAQIVVSEMVEGLVQALAPAKLLAASTVTIQTPAKLTATITASPSEIQAGQEISVVMTVTNSGQAVAEVVIPSTLTFAGVQTLSLFAGPIPDIATIPGGESCDFVWIYNTSAGDAGDAVFSGSVSGRDRNSGNSISTVPGKSNTVAVRVEPETRKD